MTDLTPTDPSDTELVSAVLDGEATAAEVARVEADPELRSRLERLRTVAEHVSAADSPPPGLADRAIDGALAHLEIPTIHPSAPPVDELSARRAASARRFAPLLAAAAAIVVVAVGAIAIANLDSDTQDTASAGLETAGQSADAPNAEESERGGSDASSAADAAPAEAPDDAATTSDERILAADLGEFENRVREGFDGNEFDGEPAESSTTTPPPIAEQDSQAALECADLTSATRNLSSVLRFGSGEIGDQPVTYVVYDTADGPLLIITDDACKVIAEIGL